MPTVWGHLERVNELSARAPHIQVKIFLPGGSAPGGTAIRIRANIVAQTLIARGTKSIDVSSLREGEFVELSYQYGRAGQLDAETVYVRPDETDVG